jgi:exodeoxyribonuclease VII large subunit
LSDLAPTNLTEWTVSELSGALRRTIEGEFGHVRVRGEVSGYRGPHASGHCYFTLKDESARLEAVIWKSSFSRLKFHPENGLEVIATGRITTFPGSSKYQIVIEHLEPAGVGALMALLEERRRKLAAEGLFDEARKKPLPFLPRVIGVVTSPSGAVIRDILHRLADRFPRHVLVWPVRVQGDGSAAEVAEAITGLNALCVGGPIPRPDLIIVARGGGSLEDLWGFNEEIVIRAVAGSAIPLVSAVGHETDWTLIDFVADRRAPTPTGAAEMAVPVCAELLAGLASLNGRLLSAEMRLLERRRAEWRAAARALPVGDQLFATERQGVDIAAQRLDHGLLLTSRRKSGKLADVAGRLARLSPQARLAGLRARFVAVRDRLPQRALALLMAKRDRAGSLVKLLDSVSYRRVLARGYAVVRDVAGVPVPSASAIAPGSRLILEFADGKVGALADGTAKGATGRRRLVKKSSSEDEPSLFEE